MNREPIGETLAMRLYAAEAAIDHALSEAAARAGAWLSAVTGQRAFSGAAGAIGALTEARGHLVQTHNTLAALALQLGLEALALGPADKPGDTPPVGGGGVCPEADINCGMVNKTLPDTVKLC